MIIVLRLVMAVVATLLMGIGPTFRADCAERSVDSSLWARDNLVATKTVHFDTKMREPADRAAMLRKLGINYIAYDWFGDAEQLATLDEEVKALQGQGITMLSTMFTVDADNPQAKKLLETFARHQVRPQLWVLRFVDVNALIWPKPFDVMSPEQRELARKKMGPRESAPLVMSLMRQTLPKTPAEQAERVKKEAERVLAIVRLSAPYGIKVALYSHGGWNGWTGMIESQLEVIEHLKDHGVDDIGIVYNFDCARDELHDDTADFPSLWRKIKPYVVAVNISGVPAVQGTLIYPSQGSQELAMMRTIEDSRWRGPVGLSAEIGLNDQWQAGDAEMTLRNNLIGLTWLEAELNRPKAAGKRPSLPRQ